MGERLRELEWLRLESNQDFLSFNEACYRIHRRAEKYPSRESNPIPRQGELGG